MSLKGRDGKEINVGKAELPHHRNFSYLPAVGSRDRWPAASGTYEWSKDSLLAAERQAILDELEELVTGKANLTIDEMDELISLTHLHGPELGKLRFILDRRART